MNRRAILSLAVAVIGFLLASNPSALLGLITAAPPPVKEVKSVGTNGSDPLTDAQRTFIAAEYGTAVNEIQLRVEHENSLFLQKLVFVGAVLGTAFYSLEKDVAITGGRLLCAWAAVLIAAIMDLRIMFNVAIINSRGEWIRGIEAVVLDSAQRVQGWETYFSANSVLFSPGLLPWLPMDRRLLTWVLFLVALNASNHGPKGLNTLTGLAASICLLIMALPGFYENHALLHLGIAGIGIVLMVILEWSSVRLLFRSAEPA